jgi:hypothetical protein
VILFLRAEIWISCICGDSVAKQFCIYRRVKAGSSGRDLAYMLIEKFPHETHVLTNHTQAGYPGIQHSGNEISFAPRPAASSMRLHVFLTDASRSSHSGSAWVAATRILFDNTLFGLYSAMSWCQLSVVIAGTTIEASRASFKL